MQQAQAGSGSGSAAIPVGAIVLGVVLIILGQFVLERLADTSDTWHYIQHGVFVVSGVLVGVGATRLYGAGQQRA